MSVEIREKRFIIHEHSLSVSERIRKALFERAIINFIVSPDDDTDESKPDVTSEVVVRVSQAHHSKNRSISVSGRTNENDSVAISIPSDKERPSTLTIYDADATEILSTVDAPAVA